MHSVLFCRLCCIHGKVCVCVCVTFEIVRFGKHCCWCCCLPLFKLQLYALGKLHIVIQMKCENQISLWHRLNVTVTLSWLDIIRYICTLCDKIYGAVRVFACLQLKPHLIQSTRIFEQHAKLALKIEVLFVFITMCRTRHTHTDTTTNTLLHAFTIDLCLQRFGMLT